MILFRNGGLTLALAGRWRPLRDKGWGGARGRGLGAPRAGVDGRWRLCCGAVVGGALAGGWPSVFQRSLLSLLVRWVDAWGCSGGRAAAWASLLSWDVDPFVDGRLTVRLMRRVD